MLSVSIDCKIAARNYSVLDHSSFLHRSPYKLWNIYGCRYILCKNMWEGVPLCSIRLTLALTGILVN